MLKRTTDDGVKILLVDDLNPEDNAMVQALYSRSATSAEVYIQRIYDARRAAFVKILNDALPLGTCISQQVIDAICEIASHNDASAHTRKLAGQYVANYNHKSIADSGSTTLFFEGVSMLAAKAIQNNPLYCGQESSTRYMNMAERRIVDPVGSPESRAIHDRWMDFYRKAQMLVADETRRRHPRRDGEDEKAYEGAVKARTFDVTRAWLPAGCTTQLSWHSNLRQAGDHLTWIRKHPLAENRGLGDTASEMLCERYPSSGDFGGQAALSGVSVKDDAKEARVAWETMMAEAYSYVDREDIQRFTPMTGNRVSWYDDALDGRPRGCVLPHWMSDLGQMTSVFDLDFGSFRDIQRHRNGVCRMPLLTTELGFESWYLEQLPDSLREEAVALINAQRIAINAVTNDRMTRQYYCSMGSLVACQVTYSLPAMIYVMELRSGPMIHPTLRKVIHRMIADFKRSYGDVPIHVNMDPDPWDIRRGTQDIRAK